MGIFYYILMPFSLLLKFFYTISGSYGAALILFAVVVKLVLFPFTMKGKKGMIQMNMVSGKMQQLQKQYGKDQQRYQMEVQKLYEREHVNPMGGCLWSFLPLLVLIPLYSIIREPLVYLMGLTAEQVAQVASALNWQTAAVEQGWVTADAMAKLAGQVAEGKISTVFQSAGYNQMYLASLITNDTLPAVQTALGQAGAGVFAINFSFLGLNLALLPTWKIWEHLSWPYIGAFLLILISAGSGVLMSKISMKTNQMNTSQQNAQMEKTNRMMMWMMPLMSLYIGFIMPVGLCLYWVAQNLLSMVQEVIAGRLLKKDYEAARLAAQERERQEKEEEKRRKEEARLERERRLEEEKKNRGKKKGQKKSEPSQPGINREDSKVGLRAYARGRSYDPNRFGGVTPYRDPSGAPPEESGEKDDLFLKEETESSQPALTAAPEETPSAPEPAALEQAGPELEEIEVEVEVEEIEVETEENNDDKEGV